ncbi:tetratricopeptide repeat protein [Qipengyuania sp. 902]|uniref:tetratricopeptide repeat protein n=1 Tax=Qipengyuania sp. 902 TaxID=3417565 RepID=UPI003EBB6411
MSWLPILLLALLTFVGAILLLKLPRSVWALFGAALLFGLAGYAIQGSPGQAGAPRAATGGEAAQSGEAMVQARREFYAEGVLPSRFVVTADAFARRGQFDQSARFLSNALAENPNDSEAWLALGNSLVEHAEGQLTPAALNAYERADAVARGNPAPTYFLGLAWLRAGDPQRTRELWVELLVDAPENADWRPLLADRIARLDSLLGASDAAVEAEAAE